MSNREILLAAIRSDNSDDHEVIQHGIRFGATRHDDTIENDEIYCYHIDASRDSLLGFPLSQYNLNYTFDAPDSRDFLFSSTLLRAIDPNSLPSSVDLRRQWGDILDQGSLGSCVSNSVAYQLRFLLKKQSGIVKNLSRLYIYYNGRVLSGYPVDKDTGLTMRNGFVSVSSKGAVEEEMIPYVISQFKNQPPKSAYEIGLKNTSITFYSVAQDLNELKKCLKDGYAISFGMAIYSSFMAATTAKTGIVPVPITASEQRLGGHAITIVGYDDSKSAFIVANSWGQGWGIAGFCYIPYQVILNKNLCGDFWTPRTYKFTSSQGVIVPTPGPTPTGPALWAPGIQYMKRDLVTYIGNVYQCLLSHKSLSVWIPSAVPAIWKKI